MSKSLVTRRTALCAGISIAALGVPTAHAQSYPTQRVEVVVPYPAGGGTDVVGRAIAEALQKSLNQPVFVTNKTGASGSIGFADVAASKADGYKICVLTPEITYLSSLGIGKISYENFVLLGQVTEDAAGITVRADAPWKSVEEFVAAVKARPGEVRVGNSGPGATYHLAALALEEKIGTNVLHVPYTGSTPTILALLAGQIDATTISPAEMTQHIAAGKLKVLGMMSQKRVPAFDAVPTLSERGLGLVVPIFRGIGVVKGTPEQVVQKLREALDAASKDPALKARIAAQSMNFSYADGPEFAASMEKTATLFKALAPKVKVN